MPTGPGVSLLDDIFDDSVFVPVIVLICYEVSTLLSELIDIGKSDSAVFSSDPLVEDFLYVRSAIGNKEHDHYDDNQYPLKCGIVSV